EKQQAATAAVAQAEQTLKNSQTQMTQVLQQEKQAAQKVANTEKSLEQPKVVLDAAQKQQAEGQKKFDMVETEFKTAMEANVAATKNAEQLANDLKAANGQLSGTMKPVTDNEKRANDLDGAVKTAETANGEAEKKVAFARPISDAAAAESNKAQAERDAAMKE